MKLNEEERQIMVNLEYERACSCLKQAEGNASMDFWDVVANIAKPTNCVTDE